MKLVALALALALAAISGARAQGRKIAISATASLASSPMFLAADLGYFREEGFDVDFKWFDAAQPVAVAVASGDAQFGITGLGAGLYNMASGKAIRIIAGGAREAPGYSTGAYFVSNEAWAKGLRNLENLRGKSFGLTTVGSPYQFSLALLADKLGFPLSDITQVPLQSFTNVLVAIKGQRVDAGLLNSFIALPAEKRGDGKIIGWVGDSTPWQLSAVLTSTELATKQPETVARFLRAYRKGAATFHDAFMAKGANTQAQRDALLPILEKYSRLEREQVVVSLNYVERDGALDVEDVKRQIAVWKRMGMVNADITAEMALDPALLAK